MGAVSSSSSYDKITNDYELVIRSMKDLEYMLECEFYAPSGKDVGMHDKITHVQTTAAGVVSVGTIRSMRRLVTIRNRLVHDRSFTALPDRREFAASILAVQNELKEAASRRDKPSQAQTPLCIVM